MTQVGVFVVRDFEGRFEAEVQSLLSMYLINIGGDNFAITSTNTGVETFFIFGDDDEINKFRELFIKYDILISFSYETKNFLFQKDVHEIFIDEYWDVFACFLFDNLTKDDVLDKINDLGIDSLNKYDYHVLNN